MAQIRSKQIADFLTTVNWTNVNATDIASGLAVKGYISEQIATVNGNANDLSASVDSLEVALSAEIYDARLYTSDEMLRASEAEAAINASIDSLEGMQSMDHSEVISSIDSLEVALSAEISATDSDITRIDANVSTEKAKIDAILLASDADKDTFVEIVSLINAVDLTNDDALAAVILDLNAEISATNSDFVRVEGALSAEISATNADVTSIDTRLGSVSGNLVDSVDSLELALSTEIFNMTDYVDGEVSTLEAAISAEISATNSDFVRVEANLSTEIADMTTYVDGEVSTLNDTIGSLETAHDSRLDALEGYIMEDAEMFIQEFEGNGLQYLLDNEVQDGNINLVNVYINGQRVKTDFAMTGLGGANAGKTLAAIVNPGYDVDADDTVVFVYQAK